MFLWILPLLFLSVFTEETRYNGKRPYITHRYIVKLHDVHAHQLAFTINHFVTLEGITPIKVWTMKFLTGFVVECNAFVAERMRNHQHIDFVIEDVPTYPTGYINVTNPNAQYNWGLSRVSYATPLPFAQQNQYAVPSTGQGLNTHIYIIDSGINPTSDQFTGRIGTGAICLNGASCSAGIGLDQDGHGTACASIAAGNTLGLAQQATIHPIQVFVTTSGFASDLIDGIYWSMNEITSNRLVI